MIEATEIKISAVTNEIRDFIHEGPVLKTLIFSKKDKGLWDQLWAALDTIWDTSFAIDAFWKDPQKLIGNNPYIAVYGLLQALFIQQDATNHLKGILLDKSIKWREEFPELYDVRQLRNETIGHPTKNIAYKWSEPSYCVIDRSSINEGGFEYILHFPNSYKLKKIDFFEIIQKQETILCQELQNILTWLEMQDKKHKSLFKDKQLLPLLKEISSYDFEKINWIPMGDKLGKIAFDKIFLQYSLVRSWIEERYGKIDETLAIPWTIDLLGELDYIFSKIKDLMKLDSVNSMDFIIYVEALARRLNELSEHTTKTDKQFSE